MTVINVARRRGAGGGGAGLFLDPYTSVDAAWSSDRRLLTSYAGNIFQIHNGTADANIGFTTNRFNSTALASHVASGTGNLTTLYDQASSKNIIFQAGTNRLRCVNAGTNDLQNGKLIFVGTGTTGRYYTNTFTAHTGAALSAYWVWVPARTVNYESLAFTFTKDALNDYDATTRMALNMNGMNTDIIVFRSSSASSPYNLTANTCYVLTVRCDGSSTTDIKVHGLTGTMSLSVFSAFDINRFLLFCGNIATSKMASGIKFAEGAIWFRDLGASNLANIANDAATYYAAV